MPLHQRWRGGADPPVCAAPPFRGAPALETTHPFHIKMNPAIFLGPRCNHDLGVLLRFLVRKVPEITARVCPDAVPEVASLNSGGSDQTASAPIRPSSTRPHNDPHSHFTDIDIDNMIDSLLEDLENSEFYCSTYATKEQPHVEGLLQTLAHGLQGLEKELAEKQLENQVDESQVRARRVLSRLLSSTNRRMHKGFLCTGCKISGSGIVAYPQIRQQ